MEQSETITKIASTSKRLLSSMRRAAAPARVLVQRTSALTWVEHDARQAQTNGGKSRSGESRPPTAGD